MDRDKKQKDLQNKQEEELNDEQESSVDDRLSKRFDLSEEALGDKAAEMKDSASAKANKEKAKH